MLPWHGLTLTATLYLLAKGAFFTRAVGGFRDEGPQRSARALFESLWQRAHMIGEQRLCFFLAEPQWSAAGHQSGLAPVILRTSRDSIATKPLQDMFVHVLRGKEVNTPLQEIISTRARELMGLNEGPLPDKMRVSDCFSLLASDAELRGTTLVSLCWSMGKALERVLVAEMDALLEGGRKRKKWDRHPLFLKETPKDELSVAQLQIELHKLKQFGRRALQVRQLCYVNDRAAVGGRHRLLGAFVTHENLALVAIPTASCRAFPPAQGKLVGRHPPASPCWIRFRQPNKFRNTRSPSSRGQAFGHKLLDKRLLLLLQMGLSRRVFLLDKNPVFYLQREAFVPPPTPFGPPGYLQRDFLYL